MYPDSHVTATPNSKVRFGSTGREDGTGDVRGRGRSEDACRAHELRVGPEVLRLVFVDRIAGEEGLTRVRELQGCASRIGSVYGLASDGRGNGRITSNGRCCGGDNNTTLGFE